MFKHLPHHIDRGLRMAGTGFGFFVFGAGCLLLQALALPLLNLAVRTRALKIRLARDIIRLSFRFFIELMRPLRILRCETNGLERLQRKGLLILANHPTLIDTLFLMAFVRQADCIVKDALWNNPVVRGPVRAAGYLSNKNSATLIDDCIASLASRNNLIIFPEGTRTPANGRIRLKRGAANVAIRGRCNITPVLIACMPPTLGKGKKWWQVPPTMASFTITVGEDIVIDDFLRNGVSDILAARHLTDYLQNYFMKTELGDAAA